MHSATGRQAGITKANLRVENHIVYRHKLVAGCTHEFPAQNGTCFGINAIHFPVAKKLR